LPVASGEKGLRQSDALFHHVKAFPDVLASLGDLGEISAVGVSDRPRNVEGSYMPCFLAGSSFGKSIAQSLSVPLYTFSHQQGHIASALLSVGREDLIFGRSLAFHLSGGTMELLYVDTVKNITPLCVTADVTAGQLIDRAGVAMGYSFPAGRKISELAENGKAPIRYKVRVSDGKVNLSGVENKTAELIAKGESHENIAAFVLSVTANAVKEMVRYGFEAVGERLPLIMAGGVSSSSVLRRELSSIDGIAFAHPDLSRDNALGTALLASLSFNGEL